MRSKRRIFAFLSILFAVFLITSLSPKSKVVYAESDTSNTLPLHLVKMETYENGVFTNVPFGGHIDRGAKQLVLTFDRDIYDYSDFIAVVDSRGNKVVWGYCGGSCIPNLKHNQITLNLSMGAMYTPLKRNETYTMRLNSKGHSINDRNGIDYSIDTSVTLKTLDIPYFNNVILNLFDPQTKPAATSIIKIHAEPGILTLTPLHVDVTNDFYISLKDSKDGNVLYQGGPVQGPVNVSILTSGEYDLITEYLTNNHRVSSKYPIQIAVNGPDLSVSDVELPMFRIISLDSHPNMAQPMVIAAEVGDKVEIEMEGIGEQPFPIESWNSNRVNILLNHMELPQGLHQLIFHVRKKGSANSRIITREILIDRINAFSDVPKSHWAHVYIERMYHMGMLKGRIEGKFMPNSPITRQEFVKMLVVAAAAKDDAENSNFSDVAADSWAKPYIDRAAAEGWVEGEEKNGEKHFLPERTVTRLEAVAMMGRTTQLSRLPQPVDAFQPVEDKYIPEWGLPYVMKLRYYGWVNGYSDRTFKPQNKLSRAEAAKILDAFTK